MTDSDPQCSDGVGRGVGQKASNLRKTTIRAIVKISLDSFVPDSALLRYANLLILLA